MRKFILTLIVVLFSVVPVYADFSYDFIRISCIKEARFLDIEYRAIHNNAIDRLYHQKGDKQAKLILEKNGYFRPGNLIYKCSFPKSDYKLVFQQKPASAMGQCGAAPEIIFSPA